MTARTVGRFASRRGTMERTEYYNALREQFLSIMYDELMPGILHNFANPLNGIMGRAKLLQRRLDEHVRKIRERYPDVAFGLKEDYEKLLKDVNSINQESDKFSDLFWDVARKFQGIAEERAEKINLSQLLIAEMRFTDFFLGFKHEVKKQLEFPEDLPEVTGSLADFSLSFFALIRLSMIALKNAPVKEFSISTGSDDQMVHVRLRDTGVPFSEESLHFVNNLNTEGEMTPLPSVPDGLFHACLLLQHHGARIHLSCDSSSNELTVAIPYR
jgi:signal transduction histidine kinase